MTRRFGVEAGRGAGLIVALVAAVAIGVGVAADTTVSAEAAPGSLVPLSITPWVTADGTWTAVFNIATPLPDGAVFSYTIHRPVSGSLAERRTAILAITHGAGAGPILQNTVSRPAGELTVGQTLTLSIPIRTRGGDAGRTLIPNPGVHPVVIEVATADDTTLQTFTLYLDRVTDLGKRLPLRVALVTALGGSPSFSSSGAAQVPAPALTRLNEQLLSLSKSALPVTLDVDPSTVDALGRSPVSQDQATELATALSTRPIARRTWAPIDMEGWATTGQLRDVQTQLVAGDATIAASGGARLIRRVWPPDTSIGPQGVAMLARVGVDRLVLASNQLDIGSGDGRSTGLRSIRLGTDGSSSVTLPMIDEVQQLTDDKELDPVVAANAIAGVLEDGWATETTTDQLGSVVSLTSARPAVVDAVLGALAAPDNPTLSIVGLDDVFDGLAPQLRSAKRERDRTAIVATARRPENVADVRTLSDKLVDVRRQIFGYRSMLAERPARLELEKQSLFAQHVRLAPVVQRAVLDSVIFQIDTDLNKIVAAPARTVTITARNARLSVRLTNGLDRPARVVLHVKSPRIKVTGGRDRPVVLSPGTNRIDIPVSVRTSGEFTVTIEVRSNDDQLAVTDTRIRVRSSVFSGVGLILLVGAGVFLVVWWARTLRRKRPVAA